MPGEGKRSGLPPSHRGAGLSSEILMLPTQPGLKTTEARLPSSSFAPAHTSGGGGGDQRQGQSRASPGEGAQSACWMPFPVQGPQGVQAGPA